MTYRIEKDSLGPVRLPADCHWGPQTQRSLENFNIGQEKMPPPVIQSFALLKKAAALTNAELGLLEKEVAIRITRACDQIATGHFDDQFPLSVWQTGSGTQTNMNLNEVISHLANQQTTGRQVHPNDDVNKGQSSNDTFPTVMHLVAVSQLRQAVLPAIKDLADTFRQLADTYHSIIKIGRTHLQDAVPLSLGQEISAWAAMLDQNYQIIEESLTYLYPLAIGGTAVGTGLNSHPDFANRVINKINSATGFPFHVSTNRFHSLSAKDGLVQAHAGLKTLAVNLMKIGNDIRLLASGPRCGFNELLIPTNEPGSSIMPGKVNPTQCEALTMVAAQIIGNDSCISLSASHGQLQLNVFMPVIIYNFWQSAVLLADVMNSFNQHCAIGIRPNKSKIESYVQQSLMLITALNPIIGYDRAADVSKYAYQNDISLKAAALALGYLNEEQFDTYVKPEKMIGPQLTNS